MQNRIAYLILLIALPLYAIASPFDNLLKKPSLLPPEEAFVITTFETKSNEIIISAQIAPGYYLYQSQFNFTPSKELLIGAPVFPEGVSKTDEFFGTQIVYETNTLITVPIVEHPKNAQITVSYRGCAPIGVCYPPMETTLQLTFNSAQTDNDHVSISKILTDKHFALALIIFFGLGILLALTPCVLPMLPILSSIILGQKHLNRAKAFELSFIYILAMSITFAIAGVIAALLGANLQSSLQQPAVLIFSAAVLIILAILLMFDYPLQLPKFLNNKLDKLSRKQKGGTILGVASMGMLSALVVSPCVTPPLIGALIYIAESGNVWLGGGALLMLGLGMGVPLILLSIFGMHILPKQGRWLRGIKILFAVLLIGLAVSLIMRITPATSKPTFDYILVKTLQEVETQIQEANLAKEPVVLDFYADWCVSCVKMEETVFPDPQVQALLKDVRFLKADVTANDEDDKALMQHFNIYGPPAILFFSHNGSAQEEFQIVGEINAPDFSNHLETWINQK
ncbi:MAG: protein-disulfide reductase DsbD [Legionellales bacterium]|jgi:thiol:disulfide interchange protein DsbD